MKTTMKTNQSWASVGDSKRLMSRDCQCTRTEEHNGTFYQLFRCIDGAVIRSIDIDSDKVINITHWPKYEVAEQSLNLTLLTS